MTPLLPLFPHEEVQEFASRWAIGQPRERIVVRESVPLMAMWRVAKLLLVEWRGDVFHLLSSEEDGTFLPWGYAVSRVDPDSTSSERRLARVERALSVAIPLDRWLSGHIEDSDDEEGAMLAHFGAADLFVLGIGEARAVWPNGVEEAGLHAGRGRFQTASVFHSRRWVSVDSGVSGPWEEVRESLMRVGTLGTLPDPRHRLAHRRVRLRRRETDTDPVIEIEVRGRPGFIDIRHVIDESEEVVETTAHTPDGRPLGLKADGWYVQGEDGIWRKYNGPDPIDLEGGMEFPS